MRTVKELIVNMAVCYVGIKAIQYYGHIKYVEGRRDEKLGKKAKELKNRITIVINGKEEKKENE